MRLYDLEIWGPCSSGEEALARSRSGPPNATAFAWVPTGSVANDVCWAMATRQEKMASTYQTVAPMPSDHLVVITSSEEYLALDLAMVSDLLQEPLLESSRQIASEGSPDPRSLFIARWRVDGPEPISGQLWVYADTPEDANVAALEAGEAASLFAPNEHPILVDLEEARGPAVFRNPRSVRLRRRSGCI